MTTTPPPLTRLVIGKVLQEGDYISLPKAYQLGDFTTGKPHPDVIWDAPHPIQSHTIGRIILGSDLINARYFRP